MSKKRRHTSILVSMFAILGVGATSTATDIQSSKVEKSSVAPMVSETALSQILSRYKEISTLEASFQQTTTLKDLDLNVKSDGKLKLVRPDQVVWEILKPAYLKVSFQKDEIIIQNGTGTKATTQTFKQGQMPNQKEAKNLQMLVSWMKMDPHALSDQYHITKNSDASYRFEPIEVGMLRAMEMTLSTKGHVQRVMIDETSGDSIEILFAEPKITNQKH